MIKKTAFYFFQVLLLILSAKSHAQYGVGHDDGFSSFHLGAPGSEVALPVELIWFNAECNNEQVIISWSTAYELNNDFFTVEKSNDGINFFTCGEVNGAGTSTQTIVYQFTDTTWLSNNAYYRLKQTDFDGQFKYSEIFSTNCNSFKESNVKIYPNPLADELHLEKENNYDELHAEIINLEGKVLYSTSFTHFTTLFTSELEKGIYLLRLNTGNSYRTFKIIKE